MLNIKRIYEPASSDDGFRILIDRLWPRGISKTEAKIDTWLKDLAPSDELRKWFSHDQAKWEGFKAKYIAELKANPITSELLSLIKQHPNTTLVYAAKDEQHNNALALQEFLRNNLK